MIKLVDKEIVCELYKNCPNYFHPLCSRYIFYTSCPIIDKYHDKQRDSVLERKLREKFK